MKKKLLSSSRRTKQLYVASNDFCIICFATLCAFLFSNRDIEDLSIEEWLRISWVPFFAILVFSASGVYRSVVRHINFSVIYILLRAILFTFGLNLFLRTLYMLLPKSLTLRTSEIIITLDGWIIGCLLSIVLIIGSRLFANFIFSTRTSEKKIVIYGAGSAGMQLAGALKGSSEMQTVAFVDQNPSLHNTFFGGIRVLHPEKLKKLALKGKVDEVLIAMPSASKSTLSSLLKEIENYSVKVRILPGLAELAEGKVLVSELKEVDVSNLLGRLEVEANQDLINRNIAQKVVLITGAGGSIGSEISRQVAKKASKIIILDANEYALYLIKNEIESLLPETELHAVLGSVTNKKRITEICKAFAVDTVYHAAAYKHVPLVEENPFEGVFNNIIGTQACVQAAIDAEVETFVLISTDKAVRPTNIMGATKRFAEMILQSLSD